MRITRRILFSMLLVSAAVHPGCFVFFQKERIAAPDAQSKAFVFLDHLEGNTFVLQGGNRVVVDALATEGMSAYQQDRLTKILKQMVPPAPVNGKNIPGDVDWQSSKFQ